MSAPTTNAPDKLVTPSALHLDLLGRTTFERCAAAIGLVLLAWSLLPVFSAQHFEAISYNTVSLSQGGFGEGIFAQNPRQPIVSEFIFATRTFAVVLIRWLTPITGSPDGAFRVVVACATIGFIATLWQCTRAWSPKPIPLWCYLWTPVLIPGVIETGYVLNDSVLGAALAAASVAALARRPDGPAASMRWYALSGTLAALAVATRIETALVAPLLLAVLWKANPTWRTRSSAIAVLAACGVAVLSLNAVVTGYSVVDTILTVARFGNPAKFMGDNANIVRLGIVTMSIGLIPLFIFAGNIRSFSERFKDGFRTTVCLYAICLIGLACVYATIPRYIYPIAYIAVAPVVAMGLARTRPFVLALITLLAPSPVIMLDGPHVLMGKLYEPYYALLWQRGMDKNRIRLESVVDAAEQGTGPGTMLTGFYDAEYLYKLILRQRGYVEAGLDGTACDAAARYRKGLRTIAVIPVDKAYGRGPVPFKVVWALSVLESMRCDDVGKNGLVNDYQMFGNEIKTMDPVQRNTNFTVENPSYKQTVIPLKMSQEDVQERQRKACEVVTRAFGDCSASIVHKEYQSYIRSYSR